MSWINAKKKITAAAAVLLLAGGTGAVLAAPAANAAPAAHARTGQPTVHIDAELTAMWTRILQTPAPQNPFGGGSPCVVLPDGTVAPFGPGANGATCTVKPGTKLLVAAYSAECSTLPGDMPPEPPNATEADLRSCAVNAVDSAVPTPPPTVTVDGQPVPVRESETSLMNITLPADNIFGDPAGTTGQSVGDGWIAHIDPLTPGTHKIVGSTGFTTTIIVSGG